MRWLLGDRGHTQRLEEAQAAKVEADVQALLVRKLTHSLRPAREENHLGARIRLAMEGKQDEP